MPKHTRKEQSKNRAAAKNTKRKATSIKKASRKKK